MARQRSPRDGLSDAFLISMADVLEDGGVPFLRRLAEQSPGAFADLLSRVASPRQAARIMENPTDEGLASVLGALVDGIRRGTVAAGKPSRARLH